MFDVSGKVALITGGVQGIGLATAKELLQNGLKAVALLDINEEVGRKAVKDVQKEYGEEKVIFVKVDVTNRSQFEDAFKTVIGAFETLDIVINNAGTFNELEWEKTIGVNFTAATNGTLLAFEHFLPNSTEERVILNVSSKGAFVFAPPFPIYGTSKYAVLALTRCMGQAVHYERKKIRVIAIAPCATKTQLYPGDRTKYLSPEYLEMEKNLGYPDYTNICQGPEHVAKAALKLIREAKNGSLWIVENSETPYEMDLPVYSQLKRK